MLYSFDIFDTLITRRVATPKGIFALMQHRLQEDERYVGISKFLRDNFFDIRVNAEELARLNYFHGGVEEITLEQIYEAVSTVSFVDEKTRVALMFLERELELQCVIGIEKNIEKVKSLLTAGERVVLISDMYMDEATIRNMLLIVDEIFHDIPIYVSSEIKKAKWSTGLFHFVRDAENADFREWLHVGDNIHSDVNVPSWLGIRSEQFSKPKLMPFENKMLEHGEAKPDVQLMIGTALNLRMERKQSRAGCIGTSFAGHVLFPYVHWLIEQCRFMKIKRLYFIARDGYVLKKIADIIISVWKLPIETHYIYASRRSLRMPAYDGTEEGFRRIMAHSNAIDIKSVFALACTLRLNVEDLEKFLPNQFVKLEDPIDYKQVCYISYYLGKKKSFRQYLVEKNSNARKVAQMYLNQEVDTSDGAFAFVDLNGTGFTSEAIYDLLNDVNSIDVKTFFYKVNRIKNNDKGEVYNFCPGTYKLDFLLELLCRAVHGQTSSYRQEGERIVPVLGGIEGNALLEYGYEEYIAGLESFCNSYAKIALQEKMPVSLSVSLESLHYAVDNPDEEIRGFFADMPFNRSGRNGELTVFAPRLTKQEIRNIFLLHREDFLEKHYHGANFDYSLLRCTEAEKKKIKFYQERWFDIVRRFEGIWKPAHKEFEREIEKCMKLLHCLGKRILLYGAGNFGKALYCAFKDTDKIVVGWLDKDFLNLQGMGYPVIGDAKDTEHVDYDIVFIAALDVDVIKEIKGELVENGVGQESIVCIYDEETDYLYYLDM